MFEASLKPKRFERGQSIEGTIVAIGVEVTQPPPRNLMRQRLPERCGSLDPDRGARAAGGCETTVRTANVP
jgi:hypothetical protein